VLAEALFKLMNAFRMTRRIHASVWLLSHPKELARMRKEARAEYEAKYTAERNYQTLMKI